MCVLSTMSIRFVHIFKMLYNTIEQWCRICVLSFCLKQMKHELVLARRCTCRSNERYVNIRNYKLPTPHWHRTCKRMSTAGPLVSNTMCLHNDAQRPVKQLCLPMPGEHVSPTPPQNCSTWPNTSNGHTHLQYGNPRRVVLAMYHESKSLHEVGDISNSGTYPHCLLNPHRLNPIVPTSFQ